MDVLSAFSDYFSQHGRVLDLQFGNGDLAGALLVPQRLRYREALSEPFAFELVCLSPDPDVPSQALMGLSAAVTLRGDKATRRMAGIVTAVECLGTDTGLTAYGLRLQSALSLMGLRRTRRVFQGKSVPDIVADILQEHLQGNPAIAAGFGFVSKLARMYSPRAYTTQYQQSDWEFIQCLLAEEGIHYRFEVAEDDTRHTLVLFDDGDALPAASTVTLSYRRDEPDSRVAALLEWRSRRELVSTRTDLSSYDYKTGRVDATTDGTLVDQGGHGNAAVSTLTDYAPQTHRYADSQRQLEHYARLRQQARDQQAQTFCGEASVPLVAGTWFTLEHHPAHAQDEALQRQFVVLEVELEAINNLPEALTQTGLLRVSDQPLISVPSSDALSDPRMACRFRAVRRSVPLVLPFERWQRPVVAGPQTATVVGPPGEEVHTDSLGRIRIQLHWQREQEHPCGGAVYDERSSIWVRVATPHAGEGFGQSFLPRVGEEVIVDFVDGHPDRPIITGSVHGGATPPPRLGGQGALPGNKALSGILSREHHGTGCNELRMDDTTGQVGVALSSSTHASVLNLGFIGTARRDGQAQARGQGMELRTEAAAALRAMGLLLSTCAQREGHQLDRDELVALLRECAQVFQVLGNHDGQPLDSDGQDHLQAALAAWPDHAKPGGSAEPAIAIVAAAGTVSATPESHLTYAGKNLDSVAGRHLQLVAAQRLSAHAGRGISLLSQAEGIQSVACQGDWMAYAKNGMHLTADGKLFLIADEIHLRSRDGSYQVIGHGHELGTRGDVVVKAAHHTFIGPASQPVDIPSFDSTGTRQRYRVHFPGHGEDSPRPAADHPYRITLDDGRVVEGTADSDGLTDLLDDERMRIADIELFDQPL
jgi:type VI secretion system secreted protein VgrG